MSLTQVEQLLVALWSAEEDPGLVPMLHGPAGTGKSSIVYQVANKLGYERVVMLRAAEMRPEDLTGPPFPYDAGYSQFHPPLVLLRLTKEWHERTRSSAGEVAGSADNGAGPSKPGKTVLFMDELPNAHPDVQATLHSLILDRTFGVENFTLLDSVRLIVAGNRREDGAHIYELSAPLRTRIAPHIVVRPTPEEWVRWARREGLYEPIIAFLPQREELFYDFDPKSRALTFASYRTWEMASRVCRTVSDTEVLRIALAGTVGPGAAAEFMAFLETTRKAPTAKEIAEDPLGTDTFGQDPDVALVVVENMISAAKREPAWVKAFLRYGRRMHEQYREILFPALLNLDGDMPEETILEVLTSEEAVAVQETSRELDRIVQEGDAAAGDQGSLFGG